MSRSPKYSRARLEEARRIALEQERQRLAAIEEQQRLAREQEERVRRARQAAEYAARVEAERRARDALNELNVQLFGMKSDRIVMTWCQWEIEDVESRIKEVEGLIKSEQWGIVTGQANQIKGKFTALLAKAQERQLQEDKRNYIQSGIGKALADMGFQVGVPYLSGSGDFNSDVVIRAKRPDGRSLNVQVPVDCDISYTMDGYPMRTINATDGKQYATCDEAQALIESFHQRMQQQFGIEMEEIRWDGKPPLRIDQEHRKLPDCNSITH